MRLVRCSPMMTHAPLMPAKDPVKQSALGHPSRRLLALSRPQALRMRVVYVAGFPGKLRPHGEGPLTRKRQRASRTMATRTESFTAAKAGIQSLGQRTGSPLSRGRAKIGATFVQPENA